MSSSHDRLNTEDEMSKLREPDDLDNTGTIYASFDLKEANTDG